MLPMTIVFWIIIQLELKRKSEEQDCSSSYHFLRSNITKINVYEKVTKHLHDSPETSSRMLECMTIVALAMTESGCNPMHRSFYSVCNPMHRSFMCSNNLKTSHKKNKPLILYLRKLNLWCTNTQLYDGTIYSICKSNWNLIQWLVAWSFTIK